MDAEHDIVVIGGSAGAIEVLLELTRGLPKDLPAAVFVVQHVSEKSVLPDLLSRAGALPACHPRDEEPIQLGRVYVAPPNLHLYLQQGAVRVVRGPKENGQRPAADVLFRSAARAYGPRVIGVVLSGTLDCGSAGLLAIKRAGGLAVVQDPEDATFAEMPRNALAHAEVDRTVPASLLARTLVELIHSPPRRHRQTEEELSGVGVPLGPSVYTCPECHGTLFEMDDPHLLEFRCRVGHGFAGRALAQAQVSDIEASLWAALRALEEHGSLNERLSQRAAQHGQDRTRERFNERADSARQHASLLRRMLSSEPGLLPEPPPPMED